MDCAIHSGSNAKEGIACYSFGNPPLIIFRTNHLMVQKKKRQISKINKKQIKWKAYPIKLKELSML